jgi:hypothetical protein
MEGLSAAFPELNIVVKKKDGTDHYYISGCLGRKEEAGSEKIIEMCELSSFKRMLDSRRPEMKERKNWRSHISWYNLTNQAELIYYCYPEEESVDARKVYLKSEGYLELQNFYDFCEISKLLEELLCIWNTLRVINIECIVKRFPDLNMEVQKSEEEKKYFIDGFLGGKSSETSIFLSLMLIQLNKNYPNWKCATNYYSKIFWDTENDQRELVYLFPSNIKVYIKSRGYFRLYDLNNTNTKKIIKAIDELTKIWNNFFTLANSIENEILIAT